MTFNLELISSIILIPLTVKSIVMIILVAFVVVTHNSNDLEYGLALNTVPAAIGVECNIIEHTSMSREYESNEVVQD
jgi:hypothetical protein